MAEALSPAGTARRAGWAAAIVALAGGVVTLNHTLVGSFYDDGLYASIGYALSHGLGYVHPNLPGHPAAVHYPPLYPLLLAPFFGTLSVPGAAFAAKLVDCGLAALAAGLIAWHAVRVRMLGDAAPPALGPAIVAAAALAIPVLTILFALLSEPLFEVLFALAIVWTDRPPARWSPPAAALVAGVAAALALLTRSIGVASGAGIVLFLLLVQRVPWRRAAMSGVPVVVAGLGWGLWLLRHRGGIDPAIAPSYGSYSDTVRQAGLGAWWQGLVDLPRPLGQITLAWLPGAALYYLFGAAALAVLGYGLWLVGRRSAVGLVLLGYGAILVVWPFTADRFVWAVLPWVALAWAAGALALAQRRALRLPVLVLAATIALGYLVYEGRGVRGRWWGTDASRVSVLMSEMLPGLNTLPEHAVVATNAETLVWFYTGRAAVPFYVYAYHGRQFVEPSPAEHRAYLERQGVTHIVSLGYGSLSARELDTLLGAYPGWLTMVQRWSGGRAVFRVNRGP